MSKPPIQPSVYVTDDRRSDIEPDRTARSGDVASVAVAETLDLLEETLHVSKRQVLAGTVRVSTRTETLEEIAEIALDRDIVDVTRVPVGAIVDVAPLVRTEGDMTIVPVVEERYVVVKQLYLKEEIHIRHHVETTIAHVPVLLRRQTAVVDNLDPHGAVLPDVAIPNA